MLAFLQQSTAKLLFFSIFLTSFCLNLLLAPPSAEAMETGMTVFADSLRMEQAILANDSDIHLDTMLCCSAFRMSHTKEKALLAPVSASPALSFTDAPRFLRAVVPALSFPHPTRHAFSPSPAALLTGSIFKRE